MTDDFLWPNRAGPRNWPTEDLDRFEELRIEFSTKSDKTISIRSALYHLRDREIAMMGRNEIANLIDELLTIIKYFDEART